MIEANNVSFALTVMFIVISIFIFLLFYFKGFISSMYDFLAIGIIFASLTPIASWLASRLTLISDSQPLFEVQDGFFADIASRVANQALWMTIILIILSLVFFIIKNPILKSIPLKFDKRIDKGLTLLLSGLATFVLGTLFTGIILSPVFANGTEIVEQSVFSIFKQSGQALVDEVSVNNKELNLIQRLQAGEDLTLNDQQTILDFFVSLEVPKEIATTISKVALSLETTDTEIKNLLDYAQEQGMTFDALEKILSDVGLSQSIIERLLKEHK